MNSKNKKIWIINQYALTPATDQGGRHYFFAKNLAKLGYEVHLIAASYTHGLKQNLDIDQNIKVINWDPNLNFVWLKVPTYDEAHSKKRIVNWFTFAAKLPSLASTLPKPDVILYSSPSLVGYIGAEILAKKLKVPLGFEVRDIWPLSLCEIGGYSEKHPFIRLLQYIEKRAYKNSDFVISNLKNSYLHMNKLGMQTKKFTWIPNGFSKEIVENTEELSPYTVSQLPKNKFTVGYTGTFGVANALESFIDAAQELKDHKDIAFVLVGKGKLEKTLKDKVRSLGLNNVYFVDLVPKKQVQSILKTFDICYIGLTKDPLFRFGVSPNKLFDYLYAGKPIIYAIDSGDYTPVSDIDAGIQIEPENKDEIATAILKLHKMSPSELKEMGDNGHTEAIKSYEYENLTKKLISVLFGEK